MKSTLLSACTSALLFASISAPSAVADVKEAARKLHADWSSAQVGIKGLLKIDVTVNGQPAQNQEAPIWGNGTVIGDGLVLTAYQTLVPDVAAQAQGGGGLPAGVEVKTKLAEIKFVDAAGEEYDAKLILHDEDLDLAFLAVDPKAENAASWGIKGIDISGDPTAQLLDDVISMARQSAALRFASSLTLGTVTSVVERPRILYAVDGISPGAPAFAADGTLLGMVTLRKAADSKQQPVAVILPTKYFRKLVPQAIEKQEALKSGGGDEVEDEKSDTQEEAGEQQPGGADAATPEEEPADADAEEKAGE